MWHIWLGEEEEERPVSDRFNFLGDWLCFWARSSWSGIEKESTAGENKSELAASHKMSIPFCSVMAGGCHGVVEEKRQETLTSGVEGGGAGKWMVDDGRMGGWGFRSR